MRAGAEVYEIALAIERNHRVFRKVTDELRFIGLSLFFHELNGLLPGQSKFLQLISFFDDFLHLSFQFIQILPGKRRMFKIIIISGIDTGPDSQFSIGIKPFHRFCQHVGCRMPYHLQSCFVICCQNVQAAVLIHYGP